MTESVLQEAERIINGDRAKDYGDVSVNFTRIAGMWGAYKGAEFTPHDVAQMMILVKVARQATGYHRDSNVDIAGYAGLDEQVYNAVELDDTFQAFRDLQDQWDKRKINWDITIGQSEPRQWEFVNGQIPDDVRAVRDVDGHIWELDSDLIWRCDVPTDYQYVGPFTEILEGTE